MAVLIRLREIRDVLRRCERLRGERDRLIREADGCSLRQLARAAGLSPTQVQRIRKVSRRGTDSA